jgi:hypothetical protein
MRKESLVPGAGAGRVLAGSAAAGAVVAVMLAALSGRAISGPDKYTVQVPNGLAFSEFRGYEDWPTVAAVRAKT